MKKVVYYNVDDDVDIEQRYLDENGIEDIELVMVRNGKGSEDPEAFLEAVSDADGVVVEYMELTEDVIDRLEKVKVISVQAIGYDGIDIEAAAKKGIAVTNAPGFCTEEVAVYTLGMIIDCSRQISYLDRTVRAGEWDCLKADLPHRLSGQTVGMVSFGSIPQKLTPMLKALGLNVIVWGTGRDAGFVSSFGAEKVSSLVELLGRSDFVSLHCPLVTEPKEKSTYHLIDEAALRQMRPSAYLINAARGGVVDEEALARALKEGTIAGAAVDVIEDETGTYSPLFGLENCIITPHSAFLSEEAFNDGRVIAISQQVERLHYGIRPRFTVNGDVRID